MLELFNNYSVCILQSSHSEELDIMHDRPGKEPKALLLLCVSTTAFAISFLPTNVLLHGILHVKTQSREQKAMNSTQNMCTKQGTQNYILNTL